MMRSIPTIAFLAGAGIGAVIAIGALLWPTDTSLPEGSEIAARINGRVIPVADVEMALEAMASDSRNPLDASDTERALGRLIDEELLLQRGVELGLPYNAPEVRRAIVLAMIDTIVANAGGEPEETQLRDLFEAEPQLFAAEPSLRVSWYMAPRADDSPHVAPAAPPNVLLRITDLRVYLGTALTRHAMSGEVGEVVGPVEVGGQFHWISIHEKQNFGEPAYEDNVERVTALWHERQQEAALEDYLAQLRSRAEIETQAVATP
jgi:hypothetical protein